MRVYLNNNLFHLDYSSNIDGRIGKGYKIKYIRSSDLAKKMYRGSIYGEKDGMLEIRVPIKNEYTVPVKGYYHVNGIMIQADKDDVIRVEDSDYIDICRIK